MDDSVVAVIDASCAAVSRTTDGARIAEATLVTVMVAPLLVTVPREFDTVTA
jgi:hypothetical protein